MNTANENEMIKTNLTNLIKGVERKMVDELPKHFARYNAQKVINVNINTFNYL